MALPKQVVEQGARADEMMQRSQGTPPQAPPQTPPQQQQEVQPGNPAPTPAFEAGWEQKYRVLQGKYNAEVPALNERVRQLQTDLNVAQSEVATLKTQPTNSIDLSAISAEEREQYGEDFVNFVAKVAKGQAPAPSNDFAAVNQRVEQLASVVAETKEDKFFQSLKDKAPSWEALNTNAGFLEWLSEVDEFSGLSRQQMFNDAYAKLNVDRVAKFFLSYAATQSSESGDVTATPLEQQVVPSVNRAPTPPPPGKKIWSAREIAKFYTEVRTNAYRGREAEMAQVEQDIFAAQQEGRVR